MIALWTVRLPIILGNKQKWLGRFAGVALVVAALFSAFWSVPLRWEMYSQIYPERRIDPDVLGAGQGVQNAIILVPGAWGSEVLARMWARGLSRPQAQLLYEKVDLCFLDEGIRRLESFAIKGADAWNALQPLLSDSSRVVASTFVPDTTARMLRGAQYSQRCQERIQTNQARSAFSLLPFLLSTKGNNLFVRDLHERNEDLLRRFPGRRVMTVRDGVWRDGRTIALVPVSPDSALTSWRRFR